MFPKKIKKSSSGNTFVWQGQIPKRNVKYFETELEAAKWVDIELIKMGKEPVNVLKRKTT